MVFLGSRMLGEEAPQLVLLPLSVLLWACDWGRGRTERTIEGKGCTSRPGLYEQKAHRGLLRGVFRDLQQRQRATVCLRAWRSSSKCFVRGAKTGAKSGPGIGPDIRTLRCSA